ncbi:MAG: aspartate/glutamate racemase family protein [bacterium]
MGKSKQYRIGILGGMGPEAGVLLQQLIIQYTPAEKDQEHIEVITYTNPHIPDRTKSLTMDSGKSYQQAVIESLQLLEKTGVDILVIACNTAHARLPEIKKYIKTPILNIVDLANQEISNTQGRVGIIATDGTINSNLFGIPSHPEKTIVPNRENQTIVMQVILDIKKGSKDKSIIDRLEKIGKELLQEGGMKLILGCTELSIMYPELYTRLGNIFIDPLRLAAQTLVNMAQRNSAI